MNNLNQYNNFDEKITNDLPDMGHSPFGPMQNFNITVPGVTKLLKTLKIHYYLISQNNSLLPAHLFSINR